MFVVGDGPMMGKMQKEVTKLGLENYFEFFGAKSNVKPFYKACDVELICSLSEGLTLTTYEAMSMQTPVVSADIGGQKELIDSNCGRLVKNLQSQKDVFSTECIPEEIDRYSNAIAEILDSKEYNEICKRCREKVLNGFTINNMIETLSKEIEYFTENESNVNKEACKNRELYAQYLVLYNQLDQRDYFSDKGGVGVDGKFYEEKTQRMKDELWQNPLWRGFIRFLQKTGLMKIAKNTGVDKTVKNKIISKMK